MKRVRLEKEKNLNPAVNKRRGKENLPLDAGGVKPVVKILINFFEVYLSSAIFLLLFLSLFLQVVLRYGFNLPSAELFEIAGYSFVWVVFLGAAFARRYKDHIRFNIIYDKLPRKVQLILDIIFDSIFSLLLLTCLPAILNEFNLYKLIDSTVLHIPWYYLFMFYPVFILLIIMYNCIYIYRNLMELLTGRIPAGEVKPWN